MINIFSYTIINIDFSKVAKWLSYKQNSEALRGASFIRASSPKDYPSSSKKKHNWDSLAKEAESEKDVRII